MIVADIIVAVVAGAVVYWLIGLVLKFFWPERYGAAKDEPPPARL